MQKVKIIIFETKTFLVFFNKLNRLETTLCLYLKPMFFFIDNGHHQLRICDLLFCTWRPHDSMKQYILSLHI